MNDGINVKVISEITVDDIKKYITTGRRILAIAKGIAVITPTAFDDDIIDYMNRFVDAVAPFAEEPWFADLLKFLGELFESKNPEQAVAILKTVKF